MYTKTDMAKEKGQNFMDELSYIFKRQPHKMVKHILTIRRQIADESFE